MTDNKQKKVLYIKNAAFFNEVKQLLRKNACNSVTIVVRGYSMRPFLEDLRDKVILSSPKPPQKGQVVLVELEPDTYILHKIIKIEGNTITMRGDGNALSQKETFQADKIIGTVTTFIRKGREIDADSRLWRTYSATWEFLRPIRRLLLAIHRRII